MSYATENKRPNPMSMALAIGLNGSSILAVALSPVIVEQIKRDPFIGEAIDIYVNSRLVARGEVVVVDDRLGVTMTEIIKNSDA